MRSLPYLVNMPFYIFLTGMFLLPFIYAVEPRVEYEQVKVFFFQRWVEIFCVSVLLLSPEKFSVNRLLTKTNLILFSFFFASLLSSYLGSDYSKSFWGNTFRIDGLFTLAHFVLLFCFVQFVWEEKWKKHLVMTIVASSLIVSLYALAEGYTSYIYGTSGYSPWKGLYGTLGNPVFLGGYLLLTLPFYLDVKNLTFSIPALLPVITILATLSRFAIFGVFLMAILNSVLKILKVKQIHLFLTFLFLTTLFFSYYGYKAATVTQQYKAGNNMVYEDRMRIYTKGLLAYLEKPVLGYGYANFDKAFESIDWPAPVPRDIYVDKAHSNFLEVLVTTGVFGFALYLLFLFRLFKSLSWKNQFNQAVTVSLFLYLLNAQVNVTSVVQDTFFWIFAGILTSQKYNNGL